MLKQVYDLLYPILQNNPICKNENLLYGLLLHVSNSISACAVVIRSLAFAGQSTVSSKQEELWLCASNVHHIHTHQELQLPAEETDYIATYLYLSSQWIDSNYIQLLIISVDNDTARSMPIIWNSLSFKTEIHYLRLHSQTPMKRIAGWLPIRCIPSIAGRVLWLPQTAVQSQQVKPCWKNWVMLRLPL